MQDKTEAKRVMDEMVATIENVLNIVHLFQDSRAANMALTKLEEALMWLNVMVHHTEYKPKAEEPGCAA